MSGALGRISARQTAYPAGEGTFLFDAFSPVAAEIDAMTDEYMPAALAAVLPDTAFGAGLDLVAAAYGLTRKPAAYASGAVVFTGLPDTVIEVGTQVSTEGGVVFRSTALATIPEGGSVQVPVIAAETGAAANVAAGMVTVIPMTVVGVTAVANPAAISGGADLETDASFRDRLLLRIRLPAASGCEADYVRWAREVAGVGAAACIPTWDGAGTVKVIIAGDSLVPAGAAVVAAVEAHLAAVRPIGALVTVVSVVSLTVDVSVTLTLEAGLTLSGVQADVEAAIAAEIALSGFGATYFSWARVGAAILKVRGVLDYANLLLNGAGTNITLTSEQVPVLGTVTLA